MKIPKSERVKLEDLYKSSDGNRRRSNRFRSNRVPPIPSAAHWGWGFLPISAKILILGVLCGLISVTTPFWASVKTDIFGYATYGLWHFCRGEDCTSIHDNILEGMSIPMWHHLVQGNMCIGVAFSLIGLAMITNSIEGKILRMSITVHRTCACVLGISAVEHFLGLYVFVTYLEETDFLFDRRYDSYILDFHGSFYCGIISFVCAMLSALIVFMDDSISQVSKVKELKQEMSDYFGDQFMVYDGYEWNASDEYEEYYNGESEAYALQQNDIFR